jgi:iron complex transport system substrate-binding protein
VRAALRELRQENVAIVSLRPQRLADVWNDLRRVGHAVGRGAPAEVVAAGLEQRCRAIAARAAVLAKRPTVLTIEWLDPVMAGGLWQPELVALAGGTPLVTTPGQPAPTLVRADLEALDPDVVLIKPCGFPLARIEAELPLLREQLPWTTWRAVRDGRVFATDGSAYFNRPGPRLVESLEMLAACVHPAAFTEFAVAHGAALRRITPTLEFAPVR